MKRLISGKEHASVMLCGTKQAGRLLVAAALGFTFGSLPASAAARVSVKGVHSSAARVQMPETDAPDGAAKHVRPFPGRVERDDEKGEIRAQFDHEEQAAAPRPNTVRPTGQRKGKLVVRNRAGYTVDVFLSVDDVDFMFVDTLPDGYRLVVSGLPRGGYFVAAEDSFSPDGVFDFGPEFFVLRRRFRLTLLP